MAKTMEEEFSREDKLKKLAGLSQVAKMLKEEYDIETLEDLLQIDIDELEEEEQIELAKALAEFEDGKLSKKDVRIIEALSEGEEQLEMEDLSEYIQSMFDAIEESLESYEEDDEEDEEDYEEDDESEEEYDDEDYEEDDESEEEEYEEEEYENEEERTVELVSVTQNIGSAKFFLGTTYIYNIFVNDQESKWTPKQKKAMQKATDTAIEFLMYNAEQYGVAENIEIYNENLNEGKSVLYDDVIAKDSSGGTSFIDEILMDVLEMSGEEYVESLREEENVDNVLFIMHINKPGRSYCHWASSSENPEKAAETCVVYSKWEADYDGDGELDNEYASTYAHEILHTFGALDLYFPWDPDEERKKLAEEYFPDEIMLRVDKDIYNLEIGEFTAHIIGWTDEELSEEYKVFLGWK